MGVVAEIADRVTIMQRGRVVESGPVAEVLAAPRHPYAQSPDRRRAAHRRRGSSACRCSGEETPARRRPRAAAARRVRGQGHRPAQRTDRIGGRRPSSVEGLCVEYRRRRLAAGPPRRRRFARSTTSRSPCGRARSSGSSANRAAARRPSPTSSPGSSRPTPGRVLFGGEPIGERKRGPRLAPARGADDLPGSAIRRSTRASASATALAEPILFYRLAADPARGARGRGAAARGGRPRPRRSATRFPHAFSGGQRQRISIARALGARPALAGLRRADLLARRVGPGADPQPAEGPARHHRPLDAVHQPRPRGGPPDVRPRRRDEGRRDRRTRRRRTRSSPARSTPIPASCSRSCRRSTRSSRDAAPALRLETGLMADHHHHRTGSVITIDPQRRIIADGAVAIERDRIVAVGSDGGDPGALIRRRGHRRASGKAMLPGLIDGHAHAGPRADQDHGRRPLRSLVRGLRAGLHGRLDAGASGTRRRSSPRWSGCASASRRACRCWAAATPSCARTTPPMATRIARASSRSARARWSRSARRARPIPAPMRAGTAMARADYPGRLRHADGNLRAR